MNNIIVGYPNMLGTLWTIGWLFTIGYLNLDFWKGFWGLFIWPYYLGVKFGKHSK